MTIAADGEGASDQRIKDAFFIVEPNQKQLLEVGALLDAGKIKTFASAVVPLEQASTAYSGIAREKRGPGKVVIAVG